MLGSNAATYLAPGTTRRSANANNSRLRQERREKDAMDKYKDDIKNEILNNLRNFEEKLKHESEGKLEAIKAKYSAPVWPRGLTPAQFRVFRAAHVGKMHGQHAHNSSNIAKKTKAIEIEIESNRYGMLFDCMVELQKEAAEELNKKDTINNQFRKFITDYVTPKWHKKEKEINEKMDEKLKDEKRELNLSGPLINLRGKKNNTKKSNNLLTFPTMKELRENELAGLFKGGRRNTRKA